ncbi:MAG: hypothetical protein MR866_04485 [Selenomonadaceae bacterium]|nr:hypothetical protein [Selenomonadaceae bacterium]
MEPIKSYDAHLDSKHRLTLREAPYEYYNVRAYGNGCYFLEPRQLVRPKALDEMSQSEVDAMLTESYQQSLHGEGCSANKFFDALTED